MAIYCLLDVGSRREPYAAAYTQKIPLGPARYGLSKEGGSPALGGPSRWVAEVVQADHCYRVGGGSSVKLVLQYLRTQFP
ncbi:MAG: hypothetical protein HOI42_14725 [Candidatus Marinimicrobia bacterium]|nr:hypothetical protein [Candidatus Neomarinimicrobiota bacterium]